MKKIKVIDFFVVAYIFLVLVVSFVCIERSIRSGDHEKDFPGYVVAKGIKNPYNMGSCCFSAKNDFLISKNKSGQ